jgi:hypothetical protein
MTNDSTVDGTAGATAGNATAASAEMLKPMLADALLMLERAEIVDFNGHMSARLPGTDRVLINAGASVRRH